MSWLYTFISSFKSHSILAPYLVIRVSLAKINLQKKRFHCVVILLVQWWCYSDTGAGNDSKIGVAGAGAGGNIAATVAHEVRGIAFQVCFEMHIFCHIYFIYLTIYELLFIQVYCISFRFNFKIAKLSLWLKIQIFH